MSDGRDLSVVIPVFNEADRVAPTLSAATSWLAGHGLDAEVIVVEDGSTDATAAIIAEFVAGKPPVTVTLLSQPCNQGKGAAVRRGMLAASGRHRLFMDADLATPLDEIGALRPHLEEAHVVIASRAVPGSRLSPPQPLHRRLMGVVFRKLAATLGGLGSIRDSQCGFKMFRGDAAEAIFSRLTESGFAFDVEVLGLALRLGLQVAEVGVTWCDSGRSSVHPIRDPWRMFLALLRIRRRLVGVVPPA